MIKYCVSYIGQVRYIDCIQLHNDVYDGKSNITAVLNYDINEKIGFVSQCKHSFAGNLTKDQIKKDLLNLGIRDVDLLNNNDFPLMDTQISLACQLFYTVAKTLETHSDYDFSLFLTTDLIFTEDQFITKHLVKNLPINEPIVFCRLDGESFYPRMFILNNLAMQNIKTNWKTAFRMYEELVAEGKDRNEYATLKLLEYCGLKIQPVNFFYALRFRPNMSWQSVIDKDYRSLAEQESNYRDYRNEKILKLK